MSTVLRIQIWKEMTSGERAQVLHRGSEAIFGAPMKAGIEEIFDDVRANGDEAVCRATQRFDRIDLTPDRLRVSDGEFDRARARMTDELLAAIRDMIDHIRRFNEQVMGRKGQDWMFDSEPGLQVGEKVTPIRSAALFCPSGKASYPSVLAQIGTPAVVARVQRPVVITPPIPGSATAEVDAATLVVADELGLREVYRANGPAAIAAVTFGTQSIPRVSKVVGPGSPAVTYAQVEAQRHGCATMMLLGPTESVVIADDSADPVRLAADLLNEAEHGSDSTSLLITPSLRLAEAADAEIARQIRLLPDARAAAATAALGVNGGALIVSDLDEAAAVSNAFGPEHLQIATSDPAALLAHLDTAGEILLGQHTTFSAANFVIGCPASLPTSGFASVASGITAEFFLKRTAIARADEAAMRRLAPTVLALAAHEGFPAHANAQKVRL